jgi:hypothetical protein
MMHTQARRSVSYGQRGPHKTLLCHTSARWRVRRLSIRDFVHLRRQASGVFTM